mmetsp:Transcript_104760/g.305883  ORF Transcript_104760/g.305883 Transcript_104760/m.305883 type:complete len:233 (+) Transcript_104760:791-1489(+)
MDDVGPLVQSDELEHRPHAQAQVPEELLYFHFVTRLALRRALLWAPQVTVVTHDGGCGYGEEQDDEEAQDQDPKNSLEGLEHASNQTLQLSEAFEEANDADDPQAAKQQQPVRPVVILASEVGIEAGFGRPDQESGSAKAHNGKVTPVPVPLLVVLFAEEANASCHVDAKGDLEQEEGQEGELHEAEGLGVAADLWVLRLESHQNDVYRDDRPHQVVPPQGIQNVVCLPPQG